MRIPFWKMHGAANDFILVDDREGTFPAQDQDWIASVSARRTGVGSDGVILIQPSEQADFRMRFFNPDGGEVEMCGNGARCVARLASDIGAAPANMTIDTVAGLLHAQKQGELVLLQLTDPEDVALNQSILVADSTLEYHFANTGVPHVVMPVDDVQTTDVQALGSAIRYHGTFAPAGTNVNFAQVTGADSLDVRTYERGVEQETWACGTGIVASALTSVLNGRVEQPVQVRARSGDVITVTFEQEGDRVFNVKMLGPAVYVCTGALEYS